MRKLSTIAFLALAAAPAFAADLPSQKAPLLPPPPPPPMWTGFYVGLNAGGTWSGSSAVNTVGYPGACSAGVFGCPANSFAYAGLATGATPAGTSAFIGGGQIGYNWQVYNQFVVGVEADIQGVASSQANGSYAVSAVDSATGATYGSIVNTARSLDYLGTVRGRLGWLATPTLLIYGTGGLAYGGVNASTTIGQAVIAPPGLAGTILQSAGAGALSDTRVGWAAGGGVEWMFWPNWSAKVEYLYYDLGSVSYGLSPMVARTVFLPPFDIFGTSFATSSARFSGNIVRAGLNYHFNWGAAAPILAKY
ncbi:outer membrane protein [Methylocystis parvus]|uniref:outer membrane protein n=1 Tax=Methylocystis parvus TaxID=134 RepID=UPI003C70B026